jgi:hypothetical protein
MPPLRKHKRWRSFAMKILQTILILTITTLTAIGQERTLTADSDTVFWFKYYETVRNEIGLELTNKIQTDFYFRFWDGRKVIELRQMNNKLIGTATFLLRQYKKNKEGRLYFKKSTLTDKTTETIFELVTKYKIIDLPTDKQIKGWHGGLDGITYLIEYADKESYSFKNYWTPTYYQDKLTEARQLVDFVDSLNKIDELETLGKKFMERQPFSSWYGSLSGSTIVSKIY